MICIIKIQSENMKMTWNILFSLFCMTGNFFKCDGFTVLYDDDMQVEPHNAINKF